MEWSRPLLEREQMTETAKGGGGGGGRQERPEERDNSRHQTPGYQRKEAEVAQLCVGGHIPHLRLHGLDLRVLTPSGRPFPKCPLPDSLKQPVVH